MSTELKTIHQILLGQRKVAQKVLDGAKGLQLESEDWRYEFISRRQTIDDLLLEIEAAGVVWPDNVVELPNMTEVTYLGRKHPVVQISSYERKVLDKCDCGGDKTP